MASRRGRRTTKQAGKGRYDEFPDYYATDGSDRSYISEARRRLKYQFWRKWTIRFAVLAVLVFIGWMWGPSLLQIIRVQLYSSGEELKEGGRRMHEGVERRSGAGLEDDKH